MFKLNFIRLDMRIYRFNDLRSGFKDWNSDLNLTKSDLLKFRMPWKKNFYIHDSFFFVKKKQ